MIIATAGHIDHGKTSLVKALTGIDTDRLPQEKARGISIDLGFARFAMVDGSFATFVDVPGHERFVRTMIAGVAGVQCALVVVAADDGVMPQTLEHLEILDLLGVTHGCIALTKADRVDAARIAAVSQDIAGRIAGTGLADAPIVPVSSVTGAGIEELRAALGLAASTIKASAKSGRFRMTVDRSFTLPGIGLVVTGVVWSGEASVGERALLSPAGYELRVRGIQSNGAAVATARAGGRFALNVVGSDLSKDKIRRGAWIVEPELHAPTSIMDVEIRPAAAWTARPLTSDQAVHLHLGSDNVAGRIRPIEPRGLERSSPFHHLTLDRPIASLHGDRFVLRDAADGSTVAGGWVIDPFSPRYRWSSPSRLRSLEALRQGDHVCALEGLAAEGPVLLQRFAVSRNLTQNDANEVLGAVPMECRGKGECRVGFGVGLWASLRESVVLAVTAHCAEHPGAEGAPIGVVQRALRPIDQAHYVDHILASLVADGVLVRFGRHVQLASSRPHLGTGELRRWQQMQQAIASAGLRPPHVGELAALMNLDATAIERLLDRAEKSGLATCVSRNRYFLPETLRALGHIAEGLAEESQDSGFTAAAFKERSGIGRNLTIEVLEFFDRVRLTRRTGDRRCMRGDVDAVFPIAQLATA